MINLKIYDPAMCCSSGVCGPNVNEKLIHLSVFLKGLDKMEYTVDRYNLAQQPEAYTKNPAVSKVLQEKGPDVLPLIFIDDKLVFSGHYPSIDELAAQLKIVPVKIEKKSSGCCSGDCR